MEAKKIYHLNVSFNACLARILVNGFQVAAVDARTPVNIAPPINAFLIGKGNKLAIEAVPVLTKTGMSSPLDIDAKGYISAFQAGGIVAPEGGGDLVMEIDLKTMLGGAVPSIPVRVEAEFDTDGPAFPELFLECEKMEEPEPLIAYAMHLRSLFAAQDKAALVKEFAPKLRDYAAAYFMTDLAMQEQFLSFLQDMLFAGPMDLKFEAGDIVPTPMCEGRIWELARKPTRPLLSTIPDKEGGQYQTPVYVARVGDALRVVR